MSQNYESVWLASLAPQVPLEARLHGVNAHFIQRMPVDLRKLAPCQIAVIDTRGQINYSSETIGEVRRAQEH